VSVLENHIPTEFLRPDRRPHTAITIGWVAGFEHQMDVDRLPIKAALQQLLDERPEVSVMSVGLGLGLRSERYRLDKEVQLVVLTQHLAQWDIGIAPIADIDFNRARSNIKLKEYAAAGIPWLASPIGPYEGMGEKQGGRLVADDDWHAQLTQLIDKPRDRRKLAKRAEKWVSGQTLERHVDAWEAVLEGALRRRGATSSG
jgi:glycosyltransferase involved in cell wall biosynthesis